VTRHDKGNIIRVPRNHAVGVKERLHAFCTSSLDTVCVQRLISSLDIARKAVRL
jgi:hypothetical protein